MAENVDNLFVVVAIFLQFSFVLSQESDQIARDPLVKTDSFLPNIILLLVDDLRFSDLGCYGNTTLKTPNIDKLAKDGVLFTRWYAQSTGTATRASILTGLLPTRTGMIRSKFLSFDTFPSLASSGGLHPGDTGPGSLAQIVGVSHSTAYIGNWDLGIGLDQVYLPMKHGFDFWYGVPAVHTRECLVPRHINNQNLEYGLLLHVLWFLVPLLLITGLWIAARFYLKAVFALISFVLTICYFACLSSYASRFIKGRSCVLFRNGQIIEQPYGVENMTLRFTREATNFIDANRKKPYLLVLSYLPFHSLTFTSKPFARGLGGNKFLEALEELDWSVGKILNVLKEGKMENYTLVVLTADNGTPGQNISKIRNYLKQQELKGEQTESSKEEVHSKFKGKKKGAWENLLRVPALIQWKGHIQPGQVIHSAVTSMDLFPTVLEVIGQKESNTELDGKSLLPLLLNSTAGSPHNFIFHYMDITRPAAVTFGQYKTIYSSLTESDQTVCYDSPLLFDIEADPDENFPLSTEDFSQILANVSHALEEHFNNRTNKWISQFDKPIRPLYFPCAVKPSCYQENKEKEDYSDWFPDIRFHSSSVEYMATLEHQAEGTTRTVERNHWSKSRQLNSYCTKDTFLDLIHQQVAKKTSSFFYAANIYSKNVKP